MLIPGFPAGVSVCSLWGQLLREADLPCQEGSKIEITEADDLEEFRFFKHTSISPKQLFVRFLVIYSKVYVWVEWAGHFSWAEILEIKQMCELSEFELIEGEIKQLILAYAVYQGL